MSQESGSQNSPEQEIDEFDEVSDPSKILPYAPKALRERLADFYAQDPGLFSMEEQVLEKHLNKNEQRLNGIDEAMRVRFWYVYDLCAYNMREMKMKEIFAGVMGENIFYASYIKNRFKVAWMVCKPTEIKVQDLALIAAGKRKMAEILLMDPKDPVTGRMDYKLVAIQMAILKERENRVFGLPTQQIVNKNLNLNAEISNQQMQKELENKDATELKNRLQDLKTAAAKQLPAGSSPASIPVEVKKIEQSE